MGRKKIPIGCILAVALLTLVSLSNVVGYQSVKSNKRIDSPLFSIRNNKGDVSSNYLGKDNAINLLLPKRSSEVDLIDRFIDIINRMDDSTFDKIVNRFITYINKQNIENDEFSNKEIEDTIYSIRNNPNEFRYLDSLGDNPSYDAWVPGCFIFVVIYLFYHMVIYPFIIMITLLLDRIF